MQFLDICMVVVHAVLRHVDAGHAIVVLSIFARVDVRFSYMPCGGQYE
jgi:hypothetical protein